MSSKDQKITFPEQKQTNEPNKKELNGLISGMQNLLGGKDMNKLVVNNGDINKFMSNLIGNMGNMSDDGDVTKFMSNLVENMGDITKLCENVDSIPQTKTNLANLFTKLNMDNEKEYSAPEEEEWF